MDFGSALAEKYRILGQEANARTTSAQGEAALAGAKAAAVPQETAANSALAMAQAGHLNEQSRYVGMQAQSQAGLQGAQGQYYQSHAALNRADLFPDEHLRGAVGGLYDWMRQYQTPAMTTPGAGGSSPAPVRSVLDNGRQGGNGLPYGGTAPLTSAPSGGLPSYNYSPSAATVASPDYTDLSRTGSAVIGGYACGTSNAHNYADGVTQVPGQGTGAVDKVPAMLAPHEAVLNAGAADHVGRHLIDVLNALGAHKMAMQGNAPQPGPQDAPQGQAEPQPKAGRGMPAPKGKAASKPAGKAPVKAAAGDTDVVDPWRADDPLGWADPVTAKTLQTASGYAQGTSFVQGFGNGGVGLQAPSAPQSSNDGFTTALVRQDPGRPANVAADMRAKLTGMAR